MDCCVSIAAGISACMTVPRKPSSTLVPGMGSDLLFHLCEWFQGLTIKELTSWRCCDMLLRAWARHGS